MKSRIEFPVRPVFLVGCGRSGTTFAQSLLAAHPDVLSFPETHFLISAHGDAAERIYGRGRNRLSMKYWIRRARLGLGISTRAPYDCLARTLADLGEPAGRNPLPEGRMRIGRAIAEWSSVLDQIAAERRRAVWLEKTPGHRGYIEPIARERPDARFIHVFREPEAVIASLIDASRRYENFRPARSVPLCLDIWNRAIDFSAPYAGHEHHFLFRYEDLVAEPQRLLDRLFDFIGVGPIDFAEIERRRPAAARSVVGPNAPAKSKVMGAIANDSKAETVLTPEDRAFIRAAARAFPAMNA